jgi:ABC-type glutathione transport system ATPase component
MAVSRYDKPRSMSTHSRPLLAVNDLTIGFPSAERESVCAVSHLSFSIQHGEAIGLLGQSGSGKTTVALGILRLLPRSVNVDGAIRFDGLDLLNQTEAALRQIRGGQISLVMQEPVMALNPVRRVGDQVNDVLRAHQQLPRGTRQERVRDCLDAVGLTGPRMTRRYPHELSGGQRQRVLIAQALACNPRLVILDEPFAALDYVSQAELVILIKSLRRRLGTALLFITHDPSVLPGLVDRVMVMSHGRIVESGPVHEIFAAH